MNVRRILFGAAILVLVFASLWFSDDYPKTTGVVRSAIEYAVVAYMMRVAAGFGIGLCQEQKTEGVWKAMGLFLADSLCSRSGSIFYLFVSNQVTRCI